MGASVFPKYAQHLWASGGIIRKHKWIVSAMILQKMVGEIIFGPLSDASVVKNDV